MTWRAASRRGLAAVLTATAVAAGSAACGGGSDGLAKAEPRATVATAAPPTTSPYAVPPVIDEAYVNRVLEGLDAAVGDIVRLVMRTREISEEVIDRLNALFFSRDDENLLLQDLQDEIRSDFDGFRDNPGNQKSQVTEMIDASASCVFAKLSIDYSAVSDRPNPSQLVEWIGLKPADSTRDPKGFNPTPWMIAAEGILSTGNPIPSPCADPS